MAPSLAGPTLPDIPNFTKLDSSIPTPFKFTATEDNPLTKVPLDYDFIPLTPETQTMPSYGFYWLYHCTSSPSAPILVTLIGGPGSSVLTKAFNRFNPLLISRKTLTLTLNPSPITSKYHLLYLESPIGSGYSLCSSQTPLSYANIATSTSEIIKVLLQKFPKLQQSQWFFNGEGFCG